MAQQQCPVHHELLRTSANTANCVSCRLSCNVFQLCLSPEQFQPRHVLCTAHLLAHLVGASLQVCM